MKYQINLLTEKKESLLDRVIYFSLNYLRYILVITQIVVIFVFFYKFKVDQEIIDLKEAADQKKEIIEISRPLLKEAKEAEFRIKQIKPILKAQAVFVNQLNYLVSVFPEALYLTKLSIKDDRMFLEGYSRDAYVIKQFYLRLQKEKKFKNISLETLKKTEVGYNFSIILNHFNS